MRTNKITSTIQAIATSPSKPYLYSAIRVGKQLSKNAVKKHSREKLAFKRSITEDIIAKIELSK